MFLETFFGLDATWHQTFSSWTMWTQKIKNFIRLDVVDYDNGKVNWTYWTVGLRKLFYLDGLGLWNGRNFSMSVGLCPHEKIMANEVCCFEVVNAPI